MFAVTADGAASTAEAGSGPIRIVVALPLTGPRRSAAAAVRQRLALWKSTIDAQGGLAGRTLQIDIRDDACSRNGALKLAQDVMAEAERAAVVIGHPCAAAAITAAPVYQQAGLLFIAAGVRHPDFTEKRPGGLVFRASGREDRQGADAGRRLADLAGAGRKRLIIHDRTVMARELAAAARDAASRPDGAAPEELAIVAGENEYPKTIAQIEQRQPGAILFVGFPAEAAILLRGLRRRGLTVPFLVNDTMATVEFVAHAGSDLDTHVEVMMPVSISRDALEESELSDALVASDTAAALSVYAEALTATASTKPQRIAERLSSPRQHLEEIAFDHNGDAVAPSYAPFKRVNASWQRADLDTPALTGRSTPQDNVAVGDSDVNGGTAPDSAVPRP